jgi:hypothetical protein
VYEMPDKVYTTGDEVRLSVEIITEENPTFVTAVFRAEDNVRQTFTMHDDLVLDEPPEVFPQRVPTKTYRAKLVSLIDVDNPPGVYRLPPGLHYVRRPSRRDHHLRDQLWGRSPGVLRIQRPRSQKREGDGSARGPPTKTNSHRTNLFTGMPRRPCGTVPLLPPKASWYAAGSGLKEPVVGRGLTASALFMPSYLCISENVNSRKVS